MARRIGLVSLIMKSIKSLLVPCLLLCVTTFLVAAILFRRGHPLVAQPIAGQGLATESNPAYVKTESSWSTNTFDPYLSDLSVTNILELSINPKSPIQDISDKQALALATRRVLCSLKAESFESFMNWRTNDLASALDPRGVKLYRGILNHFFLKPGESAPMTDFDAVKAFWTATTDSGRTAAYWDGISWGQSWLWFRSVTNQVEISDSSMFGDFVSQNAPNCGVITYGSVFKYQPSANEVLASK